MTWADIKSLVAVESVAASWSKGLGLGLAVFLGLLLIRRVVVRRLHALAEKTDNNYDDIIAGVVDKTLAPVMLVVATYAGQVFLPLTERVHDGIQVAFVIALSFQGALWLQTFIILSLQEWRNRGG